MKTSNNSDSRYLLPENMTKKDFMDTLSQSFVVTQEENKSEKISILDCFGWNLYHNQKIAIRHQNHSISLWDEDDLLDPDLTQSIESISPQSKFWWDFPESPNRRILKKLLDLRALHPVFSGFLKIEQFNLMDNAGKILVFCQMFSISVPERPRSAIIRFAKLIPVTGYQNHKEQAQILLQQLGGFKPSLPPLDSLYSALGITPQSFTIKPQLDLRSEMSARSAASTIVAVMIEKQRLNEPGIIKDIDTEFLHHFRVAIRMIRAAIAQLKEVFPLQDSIMLKKRFGALASETNTLRDLDVFIMEKEHYMSLLPDLLRDGLLPMFSEFEQSRTVEAKRISRWLSTRDYQQEIEELQTLFKNGYSALETQWSEKPAIELAVKKIQKRYKSIQKAAAKITNETPDDNIHEIRIDCKKLRYLLYFFGDLFNKKKVKIAGNHLKSLQNTLGTFNDLTVQVDFLSHHLYKIEHKSKQDVLLIASLGGLISSLHSMQVLERHKCIRELAIFSNAENRRLFEETFINESKSEKNQEGKK